MPPDNQLISSRRFEQDVTVVIVNYRTPARSVACLHALGASRAVFDGFKAVLVDGGSADGSAEILAEALRADEFRGWVSFLPLPINGGFGWANNQVMLRELQGEGPPVFFHLLNPDALLDQGAMAALRNHMLAHPRCGAVGSRIVSPEGKRQVSAFSFPTVAGEFVAGARTPRLARLVGAPTPLIVSGNSAIEADWVTGASVMLRAEVLKQIGLFDDGFFLYFEEVELMSRIKRAGWSVWHEPRSIVVHEGGASTNMRWDANERRPFYWYQSKRRLQYRLFGRGKAAAAFGAWFAGRLLWRLRKLLQPRARITEVSKEAVDTLRALSLNRDFDRRSFAADWKAPPGEPPAWMREPSGRA